MAKQKILIADDEAQIREILRIYFDKEGFEVIEAEDGAAAILKVQSEKPDILLLDIMMPVLDGIEVCKQVRKLSDLPIIMVTAKDDDDDRIAGLEIGADDYITKPFNSREVVARVKAVLRRTGTQEKKGEVSRITYPGLVIDMEQYQVTAFGNKMTFTTKEMELLWCLASNQARPSAATSFWKQFGVIPIMAIPVQLTRTLNALDRSLIFRLIPNGTLQLSGEWATSLS